jgi:hypothetical protein
VTNAQLDFSSFMRERPTLEYQAKYTVNTVSSGASGTSTYAHYQKAGKIRMDTDFAGLTGSSYMLAGKFYTCSETAGSWACYDFSEFDGVDKAVGEVEANPEKYTAVADVSRTIAGVNANCYRIDNVQGFTVRYCFSPEGVPLYTKAEGMKDGQEMVTETSAESYSASVADSVFTLPATPQAFPS